MTNVQPALYPVDPTALVIYISHKGSSCDWWGVWHFFGREAKLSAQINILSENPCDYHISCRNDVIPLSLITHLILAHIQQICRAQTLYLQLFLILDFIVSRNPPIDNLEPCAYLAGFYKAQLYPEFLKVGTWKQTICMASLCNDAWLMDLGGNNPYD